MTKKDQAKFLMLKLELKRKNALITQYNREAAWLKMTLIKISKLAKKSTLPNPRFFKKYTVWRR